MRKINIISLSILIALFLSCNKAESPDCTYSYHEQGTMLKWTAYKFVKKAGVSGSFNQINAQGFQKATSMGKVLKNLSFNIPVSSINSNNPDRDKKISNSFFGSMKNTSKIDGKVLSIDDANEGQALIEITLNGKSQTIPFTFSSQKDGSFNAQASINMAKWDALGAIAALNKVCSEQHSQDGVSKLWPDIDLNIITKMDAICK